MGLFFPHEGQKRHRPSAVSQGAFVTRDEQTMIIDLHAHTTASDGILPPTELFHKAMKEGVDVLAVTDHDTICGLQEATIAAKNAKNAKTEILPGIEISCYGVREEIHILGLGINPETQGLPEWLDHLIKKREERLYKIIQNLSSLGINLDVDQVLTPEHTGSVGRPHIARLLVKRGYVTSIEEAFVKYLNPGTPGFVPSHRLPAQEAMQKIQEAGGCAVQAHPGAMGRDEEIPQLATLGLDGIEVNHPSHAPDAVKKYQGMAKELNLLTTGGSDFHGDGAGRSTRLGQCKTPPANYERLIDLSTKRQGSLREI